MNITMLDQTKLTWKDKGVQNGEQVDSKDKHDNFMGRWSSLVRLSTESELLE